MSEQDPGEDPLPPGNAHVLRAEVERLKTLASALERTSQHIRQLRADDWIGQASDLFDKRRNLLAKSWLRASDSTDNAAKSLEHYVNTKEELRPVIDSLKADAKRDDQPIVADAARSSVARLKRELANTRRKVAYDITDAAEELATVRSVRPEAAIAQLESVPRPVAVTVIPPTADEPGSEKVDQGVTLDRLDLWQDLHAVRAAEVSTAVFTFWRTRNAGTVGRRR